MMAKLGFVVCLVGVLVGCMAAPLTSTTPKSNLDSVDLSMTVFDQHSAQSADTNKNYVILAFDTESCAGDKKEKCSELEIALNQAVAVSGGQDKFSKYRSTLVMGKANKDDFPDHKKEFDQAKVPLPAVLFWPSGHSRPSCKFDASHPTPNQVSEWLLAKLREEEDDDSLLQIEEGSDDVSKLVCQVDGAHSSAAVKEEPSCSDLMANAQQGLVQMEKTQKIWDFSKAESKIIGPADNSLSHEMDTSAPVSRVKTVDSATYQEISKQDKWMALYFHAPWCHFCGCLGPVWDGVSSNLVSSQRQPDLVMGTVDGDANPELRSLFNVTVYPTFLMINKEGDKVLGRYLGPRKVFELSNWIEDLIVAAENPVVKKQFSASEQGEHADLHPVFPYKGPEAYGVEAKMATQNLASVSATLTGNDMDECLESDEAKFTAPGAALLVHYPSDSHSFEMDSSIVNTEKVAEKLTVVDFYASWCPHCQKLNPVWDTLVQKVDGVTIGKIEMEAHPDVKKDFGIRRFPTIMYFEPGKKMSYDEARRYTGRRDLESLTAWVNELKSKQAK